MAIRVAQMTASCVAGSACLVVQAPAQQHSRVFNFERVVLDADIQGGGRETLTGAFRWTWTEGDFENGTAEFLHLYVPWAGLDLPFLNTVVEPTQIEITLNGNYHALGVDIILRLDQPFGPENTATIHRPSSLFTIENGRMWVGHASGAVTPCPAPVFTVNPQSTVVCQGERACLQAEAQGDGMLAYRWQVMDTDVWIDLVDGYHAGLGHITGASTSELCINGVEATAEVRCSASDECTTGYSLSATLEVDTGFCCPADVTDDGVLDADDFFAYLDLFASGDPAADLTGNGVVDSVDFFTYLDMFTQGC